MLMVPDPVQEILEPVPVVFVK